MGHRRPNRVAGPEHDEFWAWCARKELRVQQCDRCTHLSWPPTRQCENCDHDALTWAKLSGTGNLVSWCTFERSYYKELPVPWETIVVELDEGPLFISNPHSFSIDDQASLGTRVQVEFIECEDDKGQFNLPVFRLE